MEELFRCPVCLVARVPFIVCATNGHHACRACAETLIRKRSPCPLCRGPLLATPTRNFLAMKLIESTPECPGCKALFADSTHIAACEDVLVPCRACRTPVARGHLHSHLTHACSSIPDHDARIQLPCRTAYRRRARARAYVPLNNSG